MSNFSQLTELNKKNPNFFHVFSKRIAGKLGNNEFQDKDEKLIDFLSQFDISIEDCVAMNQVHGNNVVLVSNDDKGKVIPKTDGLITSEKKVYLLAKTADCMPVFFYDKYNQMVGLAHIGWRGVILSFGSKMIRKMVRLGSYESNILVGVGPSIGSCCYNIGTERLNKFREKFGNSSNLYRKNGNKVFVNLQYALKVQLLSSGVRKDKMIFSNICTSCNSDEYFSFRYDLNNYGKLQGEFLTVVGIY